METLESVLKKHRTDREVIRLLKFNIHDFNVISIEEFINTYNVRKISGWKKVGTKNILKLAEALDEAGISMKF